MADRSRRYSERHFKLIGAIVVVTVPLSTFIERAVGDPSFDSLYIRLVAGSVGLPLLFHDRLPAAIHRNMDLFWIASVTFILPFTFGAILTLNAASAAPGTTSSPIWVYQYLVALFIFIQLVNHGPSSVVLWCVATAAVFVWTALEGSPNLPALRDAWLHPLPVYLTALIVGSITNRNLHVVQSEQFRAASAIGSNIAHELRTPLASIRALARGTGRFLPILVQGYEDAKASGSSIEQLSNGQIQQLRDALETIKAEVDYANTVINILLVNTSQAPASPEKLQTFPVSQAIEEAVARFPFNNSREKELVSYDVSNDFLVHAPKLLVVHIFFNLIKNGLYFVQKGGLDGSLVIQTRPSRKANVVYVMDTGAGIAPSVQPRIFDRFFSSDSTSQGAGIGLSFCKMVMEAIGGDIQCESSVGEYTTFRLIFPPAPHRGT